MAEVKNLFEQDRSSEINVRTDEIKSSIEFCYKNKQPEIPELQRKINRLNNFKAYEYYRSDEKVNPFKQRINELYDRVKDFLDLPESDFCSAFPGNFGERVYELVMADFLRENFVLQKRPDSKGLPDFELWHNKKLYLFECVTRNTSLVDEFCKRLPDFDIYCEIAMLFYRKCYQLSQDDPAWQPSCWDAMVRHLWWNFSGLEREEIISIFRKLSENDSCSELFPEVLFKSLEDWIFHNLYAYCYFEALLPAMLVDKLKEMFPEKMIGMNQDDTNKLRIFLINSIASKVVEKLSKPYSNKKTPIIISVSLALLPGAIQFPSILNDQDNAALLLDAIQKAIECAIVDGSFNRESLKNLYAIVIDAAWYSWFPDIAKKLYVAHFPEGYKNCYHVIYNKNVSKDIQHDPHIFGSLIESCSEIFIDGESVAPVGACNQ